MDTSNPVMTGDRCTVGDFMNAHIESKRQDYAYLNKLVEDGCRQPPERYTNTVEFNVNEEELKSKINSSILPVDKGDVEVPLPKIRDHVLVGKWHPPGVSMAGAYVSVARNFPQRKRVKGILLPLARYNPAALHLIGQVAYTGGTKTGFSNRLAMWAGRKPKGVKAVLQGYGLKMETILDELMPIHKEKLVDLGRGVADLVSEISVNMTSSAGPPFFTQKIKCIDQVHEALNELVSAISMNKVNDFFKNNPEMLIAECKNKMDRYEIAKVAHKTRPYWAFSAPPSWLISVPCQSFTSALCTFDEKGANAYGFSWAHGGGKKLWDWMTSCKERQTKFAVYGDDVIMVWRKGGVLYEINPDFEQMDGSIDVDTVRGTISWMMSKFKTGESGNFWNYVSGIWEHLAIKSEFFVSKTPTYGGGGLRTGVVGTTLFDTVKSMLAYYAFRHMRVDPQDAKAAEKFFLGFGLVVKKGTWNPVAVNEELEEGDVCKTEKFLGAKLKVVRGKKGLEPVPYIDEEDLLKLIGNLRQQEVETGTALERRLFDSARGYMICGAFHHPNIWNALCDIIQQTSNVVVTQRVQANKGTGEQPELVSMVGDEFTWPSSDGYPSLAFCKDVYLSEKNKLGGEWIKAFPDLDLALRAYRKKREKAAILVTKDEREDADWADQVEGDEAREKLRAKIDPEILVTSEAVLTRAKFKPPKDFVKFRNLPEPLPLRKEQEVQKWTDVVEEVHFRALGLVFPYGDYFLTKVMLKQGWFYTTNGYWTRDQMKQAKNVTAAWNYEAARALNEVRVVADKSESVPSDAPEPDIPAIGVILSPQFLDRWKKGFSELKAPVNIVDDISWVSALYVNFGSTLDTSVHVLKQSPTRVCVEVTVRGVSQSIGRATDLSAKEAKRQLMAEAKKYISACQQKRYKLGVNMEEDVDPQQVAEKEERPPLKLTRESEVLGEGTVGGVGDQQKNEEFQLHRPPPIPAPRRLGVQPIPVEEPSPVVSPLTPEPGTSFDFDAILELQKKHVNERVNEIVIEGKKEKEVTPEMVGIWEIHKCSAGMCTSSICSDTIGWLVDQVREAAAQSKDLSDFLTLDEFAESLGVCITGAEGKSIDTAREFYDIFWASLHSV